MKKLFNSPKYSILLGAIGLISLFLWGSYWGWKYLFNPPIGILEGFLNQIGKTIYRVGFFRFYAEFAFIFCFFFSIIGFWLGFKGLKTPSKNFAIGGVILNLITLFLSLLTAWLLFGLARGL